MKRKAPELDSFPMGFVHGDPLLTAEIGYDFRQLPVSAPSFYDAGRYPEPINCQMTTPLAYHSMAIAGESLSVAMKVAIENGERSFQTQRYGNLPLSLDQGGKARRRILDNIDIFDEATRRYLHDFVRAHVRTQVEGPLNTSIRFWGLDNEWEGRASYSNTARHAFVDWLDNAYRGDIDILNRAWGKAYVSFKSILEDPMPEDGEAGTQPARYLDWRQFQSSYFTDLLVSLSKAMYEEDPLHRGVIHKATQLTIEMPSWRERLLEQESYAEQIRHCSGGYFGVDMYGHGDRQAYELNYVFHCISPESRRPGYGVMLCENNNHTGPGSQFSATQWRLLANGLKGMVYFTTGFAGGEGDWDVFAFVDPKTGVLKDKFFYASRWANHVKRLESFWKSCVPANDIPRVALLLPRRDVVLSTISGRNPASPRYSYPLNHRWLFYRWLREQGYWVDVIPYTKLTPAFLKEYEALCLIGANHLTRTECETIDWFVRQKGGLLLADELVGYYDEHHQPSNQLDDLIGNRLEVPAADETAEFNLNKHWVQAHHLIPATPVTATRIVAEEGTDLPLYRNQAGRGIVLYAPFALGSLELTVTVDCLASAKSDATTAESEEYTAFSGEFTIGSWLATVLQANGLSPAYQCEQSQGLFRIEQPQVDENGNCAVVVSTRAQTQPVETLPAGGVKLRLPEGTWVSAWWASSENNRFMPCPFSQGKVPGFTNVKLPAVITSGVLYMCSSSCPPLLGIAVTGASSVAVDGFSAKVRPGEQFSVLVTLISAGRELGAGELWLNIPKSWEIDQPRMRTTPLTVGGEGSHVFKITVPENPCLAKPDRLSRITAYWNGDNGETATAFECIEWIADRKNWLVLLSDNASVPASYPRKVKTGATYRYIEPKNTQLIADPLSSGYGGCGNALTNGFGSVGGQRHSHHRDQLVRRHVAFYLSSSVEVEFDLQGDYDVMRVVVVAARSHCYPNQMKVSTSIDGSDFRTVASMDISEPVIEFETPLFCARARYIRITVSWPDSGGGLDEVEIWGH